MSAFNLEIVTPIRDLVLGEVIYARCPGFDGAFGIMSNHREGIIALNIGEIKVRKDDRDHYYASGKGFAEIFDNKVKLLVESIEKSSEIDVKRAKSSLDRAKLRKSENDPQLNLARLDASLTRALNRLTISNR